jgi:hypothetical protein
MSGGAPRGGIPFGPGSLSAQINQRMQFSATRAQSLTSAVVAVMGRGGGGRATTLIVDDPRPPLAPEAMADPLQPDTLGWRAWYWDHVNHVLISPMQRTEWPTSELRCEEWSDRGSLRGNVGIHARRMPVDWRKAGWPDFGPGEGPCDNPWLITGVVERFGRYVLGTVGWRAEWVMIRALMIARTGDAGTRLVIERRYPEVPIFERSSQTEWRRQA